MKKRKGCFLMTRKTKDREKTNRKGGNNVNKVLDLDADWCLFGHGGGGQDGNASHHGVVSRFDHNLGMRVRCSGGEGFGVRGF